MGNESTKKEEDPVQKTETNKKNPVWNLLAAYRNLLRNFQELPKTGTRPRSVPKKGRPIPWAIDLGVGASSHKSL